MMRGFLAVVTAGLTASAALGSNLNISVQQANGTNAITVAPGGTVNYQVVGLLSDNLNRGLGLVGLSLDFALASPGGDLLPANSPPANPISCANPMRAFNTPDGITNPAGYGGTIVGGNIVQACGAQNTIKNPDDGPGGAPDAPIGPVLLGVAKPSGCGQAVLLTGSLTVPLGTPDGVYPLSVINSGPNAAFANVIPDDGSGADFYTTEAAAIGSACVSPAVYPNCSVFSLNITVAGGCVAGSGPAVTKWESVITHSPNQPVPIALEIPNTGLFSEPRSGIKKIVVTFSSAINPATATPANVTVCGNNSANSPVDLSGVTVTAGTVAGSGDTKMEINFAGPSGSGLPDYARYRIALKTSVQNVAGCSIEPGAGGLSRILTALQGDAGGAAGGGDRRVNSTDLTLVRGFAAAGINPIDPATLNHVRSDVNNDGRINSTDLTLVRNRAALANNAQSINDPVCP